jgi:xylan 1,4-beta-xylosidase
MISNPILPGFHPDPSICRVGDDYYIATSTFEWWPAVRIHHSRDLANWEHCTYAVTRVSQLDLLGHQDSTGVWAPCLSYSQNKFWLIYSDVRSMYGAYKDVRNFLVTADNIEGPWSEPIYLNSSGFDPSLFHDTDGRIWLLNQRWQHTPGNDQFDGIIAQEYDAAKQCLVGPVHTIFGGTGLGVVEGPHLYQRGGFYYLLSAEGGTFYEHAVSMARSKSLLGPYEIMPGNPLLTALQSDPAGLQRAGHGSLVEGTNGEWYLAHLCGRPLEWNEARAADRPTQKPLEYKGLHCPLGRETALQAVEWRADGWPQIRGGGNNPLRTVALSSTTAPSAVAKQADDLGMDHFDQPEISPHLNSLRVPMESSWVTLTERPGFLRLCGRESLMSTFEQSLVARRLQHFVCDVETVVDYSPKLYQQMAGLVVYYNTSNHFYLHVTANQSGQRVIQLTMNQDGALSIISPAESLQSGSVKLRAEIRNESMQFFYAVNDGALVPFGKSLPMRSLSDEYVTRERQGYFYSFGFTGAFVGICCQDLSGQRLQADFDYLLYNPASKS